MSSLKLLINSRKYVRSRVTAIHNSRTNFNQLSEVLKQGHVLKLNKLGEELKDLDKEIMELKYEVTEEDKKEKTITDELTLCEEYGDKIIECITLLTAESAPTTSPTVDVSRSFLKSPTAPLPFFKSGEGENLNLFLTNFESTLSKFNYTDYDKFLLLKQQVSGKASYLLESLEPISRTYSEAKKLLQSALADTGIQKFNVIRKLTELRLNLSDEPFKYIGDIKQIQQSVSDLKIDINDIMQYFFLNGLNEVFRNQLVQLTNKIRPTLEEIIDNFFKANEMYLVAVKSSDKKRKDNNLNVQSNTYALNIETKSNYYNPFINCSLCKGDGPNDHGINRCSKFPLPKDKINRLKHLGGCDRCGYLDHTFKNCRYRFKNSCTVCSKWHFSFLCSNLNDHEGEVSGGRKRSDKSESVARHGSKQRTSQNSVAIISNAYVSDSSGGSGSILPTFTGLVENGYKIRALRDSGSQCNLVSEKVLQNLTYDLIENDVDLRMTGINESKSYKSKLIKFKLQLGSNFFDILAVTIPSIDISLDISGLGEIVHEFNSKGYHLADDYLNRNSNKIDDISLILGVNSAHCFDDFPINFGEKRVSTFCVTPFGTLLLGDVEQLLKDRLYLPKFEDISKTKDTYSVINDCKLNSLKFIDIHCKFNSTVHYTGTNVSNYNESSVDIGGLSTELLDKQCDLQLNRDVQMVDESNTDLDIKLVNYLLETTRRKPDGRLVMRLLWNSNVSHLLAGNFNLAKSVLKSNKKKLLKNPENMTLMDETVKELESIGAIERVPHLDQFIKENPTCSFLPHMPVIKLQRESTKCRMVYLSNLKEQNKDRPNAVSHNQAMHSGPCLNQKLTIALILLRFDSKLLCFDLKKAFLQIELEECDQYRLLFLWYTNVSKGDFSLQAYKNVRLSFGLRCSPTILMVGLYKILILDVDNDSEHVRNLKRQIYSLIYMDNGSITTNSSDELLTAYRELNNIFNPYCFELQQICSNDIPVRKHISGEYEEHKELFGLIWNLKDDTLTTKKKILNEKADTKRKILQTIAENFDPFNFDGPLMNRARIFLHELQLESELSWDTVISKEQQRNWINIAKQLNNSDCITIPRFVGKRQDTYRLIAFCDSSKLLYGTVIFIQCKETLQVNFLLAKNRMINRQLEGKSIPSLELLAIVLGAETLLDLKHDLSGDKCLNPIKIEDLVIYSDSLVALNWIHSYYVKFNKMNKQAVFVLNRLEKIRKLTNIFPIHFSFVDGQHNPADCITRPYSHKMLSKSNYISGPKFLISEDNRVSKSDLMNFVLPSVEPIPLKADSYLTIGEKLDSPIVVSPHKYSSFSKLVLVYEKVLEFIEKMKSLIGISGNVSPSKIKERAVREIIKTEQKIHYSEIFDYFNSNSHLKKNIPNLITQLNIFIDSSGLLRIGSKMLKKRKDYLFSHCPILLPKESYVTMLIIRETHEKLRHSGVYVVLAELRKKYWIPQHFSSVKKILRKCVHCKRFNERTIKLNQSPYRELRINPTNIPFSNIYMDYLGPFMVKGYDRLNTKVWILCITCMWTRAINLKLVLNLSTEEFLRSFQLHIYEFGIPLTVCSDLGTQLVAGGNIISNLLDNYDIRQYFKEHNFSMTTFSQYFKGRSELGSLAEICVKMTKKLVFSAIKKSILPLREFELLIAECVNLLNKRPISFQSSLRSCESLPNAITPEQLLRGYDTLSLNVIPQLAPIYEEPEWTDEPTDNIRDINKKLRSSRMSLKEAYNNEFLTTLITQAIGQKDKYKPVLHKNLHVGDIVLVREENHKPSQYPMAIVKTLQINDMGETTGAILIKGKTMEHIKRHVSTLIPILQCEQNDQTDENAEVQPIGSMVRQRRKAAIESQLKTNKILAEV